ncbi:acetoacetate--CoA ligase [Rhodococcus sp. ACT016]|uniref:acetoacetate--CoA ligase n=1 Tax=Rhodococcus sp. ACT016 TaxID=3134808 RepID=UPI003D27299A
MNDTDAELLWEPTDAFIRGTVIDRFRSFLREERGLDLPTYDTLWNWSTTDVEGFWATAWEFFGLYDYSGYDQVLTSDPMPEHRWFPGAHVNFAKYLLAQGGPADTAIVTVDETGAREEMDRAELRRQVGALAATLRSLGVRRGDVVAGYLPNTAHAVIGLLATATLGAVWASVGQDYAASAVVSRLGQLRPVALITADGYRFNGREHPRVDAVDEILAAIPTIAHTILVSRLCEPLHRADLLLWEDAVSGDAQVDPVAVEFSEPLWTLFSSGTTGVPKGLVHSHGGVLLEMLKMLRLQMNIGPGDRFFWYTSPSWMMWNVLAGALTTGASIVCYEGAPAYPDETTLWRFVEENGITFFGTSPGYLQACAAADIHPRRDFDLCSLRAMGSTGSPLSADTHRWARERIGDLPLNSSSGGTDVVGAFLLGAPDVPVWAGELSARGLGVCVESWSADGYPVAAGEVGELVITRPMPSMPVRFWNDPDGSRYRDAYFAMYPGVWRHGDWITLTERGSGILHGRSDATLNRNGIRMGSGDIYAVVDSVPGVAEALVIGVERPDGSYWMPMFVVARQGRTLQDGLRSAIEAAIRSDLSPRHLPDEIIEVAGIPHTKTGKKLEVPIKKILLGADPASVVSPDALDDATLLDQFVGFRPHGRAHADT